MKKIPKNMLTIFETTKRKKEENIPFAKTLYESKNNTYEISCMCIPYTLHSNAFSYIKKGLFI